SARGRGRQRPGESWAHRGCRGAPRAAAVPAGRRRRDPPCAPGRSPPWRARTPRGRWTRGCRGCGRGAEGMTWGENIEATAPGRRLDRPHHQTTRYLGYEVRRLGRHDVARVGHGEHVPNLRRIEENRGGGATVPDRIEGGARVWRVGERGRRRAGPEAAPHHEHLDPGHVQRTDRGGLA